MRTKRISKSWSQSRLTLAATLAWAAVATAQDTIVEPDGMPVYRQQKSGFFQNPFSQGYQKLWKKARNETPSKDVIRRPAVDEMAETMLVEEPSSRPTANRSSKGILSRRSGRTSSMMPQAPSPRSQVRRTAPTTRPAKERPAVQSAAARSGGPPTRVIHVDDVNEGTPAVGTILEVDQPDLVILESLGEGEKIVTVTERVIGVYRDGKLVTVSEPTPSVRHRVLKPSAKQEVDPWFGDMIDAPTDAVQSFQEPANVEALPPQSYYYEEPNVPELPEQLAEEALESELELTGYSGVDEETVQIIEPTGYELPNPQVTPAPTKVTRRPARPATTKQTWKGWR